MGAPSTGPSRATLSAAVFAATLALYLLTFPVGSDGLILGNDVVPYAQQTAAGAFWNPAHLAFHPLAALLAEVFGWLGGTEDGIVQVLRAQKLLSALGGAATVWILFRFTARLAGSVRALLLAGCLALATGPWLYASVGETYAPATAALAGLLVCAVETALGRRDPGPRRAVEVGAWLLAAVLLRQDCVLVVVALPVLLRPRHWVAPVALAGLAALGLHALAWLASGSEQPFWSWLRGLEQTGLWGHWGGWTGLLPWFWSTAFLCLTFAYAAILPHHWPGLLAVALFVAALVPPRRWRDGGRRALAGLAVFALARHAFFTWWEPNNMEHHTATLVPLFLIAALLLRTERLVRLQTALLAAGLVAVGAGNALVVVLPDRAEVVGERAARAIELAGPDGLVVSLNRLQHYAQMRAAPRECELLDASDLMPEGPLDEARAAELADALGRIDRTLERGGRVVFVRDTVLPRRMHWPDFPIAGLARLVPEGEGSPLAEPGDEAGPWGWILP